MANARITLKVIAGLGLGETVWDTIVRGFGIRRQRRDPVYVLKYRFQGRQRFYTIGRHGAPWTPEAARSEALRLLGGIRRSETPRDPSLEKSFLKTQPIFAEFAERYLTEYAEAHKKPRTVDEDRRNLRLHITPLLAQLRVCEITRADVAKMHASRRQHPANANRCLATLSHMMSVAEIWGLRAEDSNPCRKITRYREFARERSLSADELHRLARAIYDAETDPGSAEDWRSIACFKLLLFTGARLGEIIGLRWEWIDWNRGLARLPDSKTGRKNLLLSDPALSVLSALPLQRRMGFVLPGVREDTHFVGIQKPWQRVRQRANLNDVRLHDFRHTYASRAVSSGNSLYSVSAILGHRQPTTTQRYAHLAEDPVRAIANNIAVEIAGLLSSQSC